MIKYQPKQKLLLPCHDTSKLKEKKMDSNDKLKGMYVKNGLVIISMT